MSSRFTHVAPRLAIVIVIGVVAPVCPAAPPTPAVTLPVPCLAGACTNGLFHAGGFVTAGQASATQTGSKLTVNQSSNSATLNWQSFNISAGGTVQFVQPNATAVALNQISDANPSQISGALQANGRVFLINQNGIIFGSGAQVNVGGLLASTLNISPDAVINGLNYPSSLGNPAFQSFASGTSGPITISSGATLQTASGGQILIFAPTISNQGVISAPAGQALLAAGSTIYLASSTDPNLRGLLVEVGGNGGTLTNGTTANASVTLPSQLVGQIVATDGNVTLAGLAVNQLGRVSATTSINENGSIRLQAAEGGSINSAEGTQRDGAGGTLILGPQSDSEVTLDTSDPSTTVDSVQQLKSGIDMTGDSIQILNNSTVRATSGTIALTAMQNAGEAPSYSSDGSSIYVAPGVILDVSGASVVLPVSSNVIPVQLRGTELADSPLQQNGPLRGQTVNVDIRTGTPLADISGEIAAIGHNVVERNLTGGTITVQSHGDAILSPGAQIDVAGGQIQYTAGYLDTSKLITTAGQIVDIGAASPDVSYAGIANTTMTSDAKWGTSSTYAVTQGTYSPGYVEGKDAGTLALSAPQFVFDANVNGATTSGIYQRQPDTAVPTSELYRGYQQVPQAASLIIGTSGSDFVVGNVTLAPGLVLPGLVNADGSPFDPVTDALPASDTTSVLHPDVMGKQGFGNISIYTDGEYLQPANIALALPAGGSFSVHANLIDVEGAIDVPGGSISLTTASAPPPPAGVPPNLGPAMTLGPQAALTATGEWVNDSPLLNAAGNAAPLFINGGSVSLTTQAASGTSYSADLRLAPGSLIDVSGGGQLTSSGVLNSGVGGSITIAAEAQVPLFNGLAPAAPALELGATMRGYGLYKGGSLSLTASSICIAAADCTGADPTTLWVTPAELANGGFSSYALNADQGGLTVAPDTTVILQQQNLLLPSTSSLLPDRGTLIGSAKLGVLPSQLRTPVSLSLTQIVPGTQTAPGSTDDVLSVTGNSPSLVVGEGALIQADPGANVALASDVRIIEEGTLRAPGGSISLSLGTDNLDEYAYEPTQGIWLGQQGVLDASGTAQTYLNSKGLTVGQILGGGSVSLTANRGYVELLPGSLINVAGTSGIVDATAVGGAFPRPEQAASAGGSVALTAAEGIELGGSLEAAAGTSGTGLPQPAGGSFSLTMDGSNRRDSAVSTGNASTFPVSARQILVSATQPPIVIEPGQAVPEWLAGNAYVAADALATAGFDSLSLRAVPLLPVAGATYLPGTIDFVGNVSLSAGRSLSLDAAGYSVSPGAVAKLLAPYVEFGNSDQGQFNNVVPEATAGSGTLQVTGGFIELYGTSALEGIGAAQFDSTGDLRLRGLLDSADTATTFDGALNADGNVELTAQQIYPATLSQFAISADPNSLSNPTAGSILIQGAPGDNQALLSAGGSVTLSAGSVTQNGVLRAPLGTIQIDAQSIALGANSVTSTSTDGLTIPFGTTQGGIDWVYPLPNGNDVVYGTDGIAPPSQRVTLQGARVNVQSGAIIDVSGGGDLQAYEWINGTGGTNDVLSQSFRPNQFAILPDLAANVTPYDPNISNASTLQVGQAVYLSGMPGLASGVYQLLPARYALLPGAYLVSEVAGYQDIQSGQTFNVPGGGTIVAGYNTVAGTPFGDSRTNGFEVVPASVVLQQAQYTLTSGNQFFSSQAQAATTGQGTGTSQAVSTPPLPRLPRDSGVLALIASDSLTLDGTLRTTPAVGGLGAVVDISSAQILVAPGTATTQPGQILLTASSLDALGAQTLLLGGGLQTDGTIDTTAQSVEIAGGTNLSAPVVLMTAQNQISVDSGASISAAGAAPAGGSYTLTGDGAFLSVSAGTQSSVTRSNSPGVVGTPTGTLTLAPGSSITDTGGSVYLEAASNVVTGGALALTGSDLAVQSPQIILGAPPSTVTGTVLGSSALAAQGLRNLLLESTSSIELFGSVNASAQNITLDAPGLSGFGSNSDAAVLTAAKVVTLGNSQGVATGGAGAAGTGVLDINASEIIFSGGTIAASGLSSLALNASGELTATGSAALASAGDLAVTASRITTGADVDLALSSTSTSGAVSLLAPAQPATLSQVTNLGGSLAISGSRIDVATNLVLPSGRVTLTSTSGDLSVQPAGSISVAGVVQQYDGVSVPAPGGSVTLTSAGNITLSSGSSIDVSAGSGGQGGSLAISAPAGAVNLSGTLTGQAASATGASFSVDAQQFGGLDALNQSLNSGGFSGGRSVRLRGPGDLIVDSGSAYAMTANDVSLEADQGRIVVNGLIDAAGTQGGSVTLASAQDLVVNGTIDAHATSAGQAGGNIALETTGADLLLNAGSSINVSGGGQGAVGGQVLLRAPSATVTAVLSGGTAVAIAGSIAGSSKTELEAFTIYQNTTGVISTTDTSADPSNPIYAAAANFMTNASAITQALGQAANSNFVLLPGVEIDATMQSNGSGALELDAPWNLAGWRFGSAGNVPGILTLRAQNGVTFNASLSDGFAATSGAGAFTLPSQASDSWSYRITAGADFTAANPLTTNAANPADVTISACTSSCSVGTATNLNARYAPNMVRTGDGFIDVSASQDFVLGNQQSMLYTAGVAGTGITLTGGRGSLQGLAYPTDGGAIQINVGHNVDGAPTNQFVNDWLWRVGSPTSSATAWTVDFQSFQQGIAALGGGNVSVTAGGDISNLSVSIPTIGVQVGGTTAAANEVQEQGGGNLTVTAGGSIQAGSYYVGRGSATLQAGNDVGAIAGDTGGSGLPSLGPIIGLGDANLSVTARGDVALAEVVNPTLLNRGLLQGGAPQTSGYFSTYGPTSSVSLTAVGGNVVLDDLNNSFEAAVSPSFLASNVTDAANDLGPLDLFPAIFNAYALSGDIDINRVIALSPSPSGNLQLFANQNVTMGVSSGTAGQLILSDADPNLLPSPAALLASPLTVYDDIVKAPFGTQPPTPDQHAATPVYAAADQTGLLQPARIVALNGSVESVPNSNASSVEGIWSAKPVQVVAGLDVVNLNLIAQNLGAADVTSVTAGGDITYTQQRTSNGQIAPENIGIALDGPGQLQVTAGGNIDLGTSEGISTRANLVNPVLPANGASVSVEAGIGGGSPQYASFIQQYIDNSSQFDSDLVAFVQSIEGNNGLTSGQAKQQFSAMTLQLQRTFVEQLFFDLLRIYGSQEAASANGDFSGAFAAISALFPGANPNLSQGQTNPYAGNIDLYFSQIYTDQGGSISLLAPGGEINVGLSEAPTTFGIDKQPDQLGIVARTTGDVDTFSYSDFQVNQSRVFAAGGGDILVWSTDGNIDAGRGSKTAVSAPALNIAYDANGDPAVSLRAAIAGSGIQALAATPGVSPGNVYLFAPHGVVNADDAGIVAGNLTVAATAVLGASNITVSGTSVGVPVAVTGLGNALSGASSTAGAAANTAENFGEGNAAAASAATPLADAAISWLDVFVTGLGDENCKPDDMECMKRQSTAH